MICTSHLNAAANLIIGCEILNIVYSNRLFIILYKKKYLIHLLGNKKKYYMIENKISLIKKCVRHKGKTLHEVQKEAKEPIT